MNKTSYEQRVAEMRAHLGAWGRDLDRQIAFMDGETRGLKVGLFFGALIGFGLGVVLL